MNVDTIDFYVLVCADQNVLHPADHTGLNQVRTVRRHFDGYIGCLNLKALVVDDVFRVQIYLKTESLVVINAEFRNMILGNTATLFSNMNIRQNAALPVVNLQNRCILKANQKQKNRAFCNAQR